ncbi:MAG: hypothetical protein HY782_22975 [Chloroflexi bacterium]|nr:hypothetical protein [Chloroflexota bacterium]
MAQHKVYPEDDMNDQSRPYYNVDYSKAKPNRFAGRVKLTHGGTRKGAGRKPAPEPIERHTITFYKSHAKYLRSLDSNLSQAIRKLIAKARE